ncbi:MAG TPA: dTMP kinase [Thermoanaerobaculia bacterium]|nr:dTMP kinase [Thermoanaerobaculia bacterium]
MAGPLFVTFEGLDGSGKTSHLRALAQRLRSRDLALTCTHEPGGTELGDALRSLFKDRRWPDLDGRVELMLLFASRRQHLLEVIEPALAAGRHVLCDRFTDSTLAYQGAGREVDLDTILAIDRVATGCRRPDRTLLLDLEPEQARARRQVSSRKPGAAPPDRLDDLDLGFYRRVRERYLELARAEPERFVVIDAAGERALTAAQIDEALGDLEPTRARRHAREAGGPS